MLRPFLFTVVSLLAATAAAQNDSDNAAAGRTYADIIQADKPVAYWNFDAVEASLPHAAKVVGTVKFGVEGPAAKQFPLFSDGDRAVEMAGGRIIVPDPGDGSLFDFDKGDSITLEAWVNCTKLGNDQQVYLVGKGRTKNAGFADENQNWALRLRGEKGQACVSFLFRSADNRPGNRDDFHRWNTKAGFAIDSGWHHVAVTYTFGEPKSIRGYIDGVALEGEWDYGGATDEGPVVDNDEVWLGSSLGGAAGNTLAGRLDEVAIYRTALSDERIKARFQKVAEKSYVTEEKLLRDETFLVEIFEGIPDKASWDFPFPEPAERFHERVLAMLSIPPKYNARGIRDDLKYPIALRMSGLVTFPNEDIKLLLRSRDGARLFIDNKLVVQNPFYSRGGDGHNAIYPVNVQIVPGISPLPTGDHETLVEFRGTGKPQRVTLEVVAGTKKRRPELGELVVAYVTSADEAYVVHAGTNGERGPVRLAAPHWEGFLRHLRHADHLRNQGRRASASREYAAAWTARHAGLNDARDASATIDGFIQTRLAQEKLETLPLVDDWAFLRRASLDTIGVHPTQTIVADYFRTPAAQRRAWLVERLLAHPGWADHWTSYWQDVLAENPNIINPTLNNTGPFRWWIHESFEDNKPLDRFATELILMEGSLRGGGTAGFGMASQNDAPMAAKAQTIAQAFLGIEMKCARCHDAPYHDVTQKQLFSLAAMLKGSPEQLPKTSTIPGDEAALKSLLVKVTLKPGEKISPAWPFEELVGSGSRQTSDDSRETSELWRVPLQEPYASRARVAELVTSPHNNRFAYVFVNRLWARYLGRGLVEPVDDWEHAEPSHPDLLEYLAQQFVASGYDVKHVARQILNSHVYQRQVDPLAATDRDRAKLYAGVPRRRLSAEQVVDTLFYASGKPFGVEDQNIDVDSGRQWEQSINLGPVTRSWQFASLSNERDRPSLSLPATQNVIDVLEAFGWRASRPDPLTIRTVEPSPLQAAILANGVTAKRISQLSDDSDFTQLAIDSNSAAGFVRQVYHRLLVREPTAAELQRFAELLSPGFAERIVRNAPRQAAPGVPQTGVSWSNHLKPEASERKLKLKEELALGDPPTKRLAPDWRERAEDVIWTLINSPEFVLVP